MKPNRITAAIIGVFMPVSVAVPAGVECGWKFHFKQLDGTLAQQCLSAFRITRDIKKTVTQTPPVKTLIRSVAMPAVCLAGIPCGYRNDSRSVAITNGASGSVTVGGSATVGAKVELGVLLGAIVGAEGSGAVTTSGSYNLSWSRSVTDTLTQNQQDCHNTTWKLYSVTRTATGTITEREVYEWSLNAFRVTRDFFGNAVFVYDCPPGPVKTECLGKTARGSANSTTETVIEQEIEECCQSLLSDPPCCYRGPC